MREWWIPVVTLGLGLLGVLTLRSVAPALAAQQLAFLALSWIGLLVISRSSAMTIRGWRWWWYFSLCVGLCIPLLIGETTRGISAWIKIGSFFSIQPSQFAIPIVALVVAERLPKPQVSWSEMGYLGVIIGIPALLIGLEPDLGTLIVYLASLGSMVFISHIRWRWIIGAVGVATMLAVTSWWWWLAPYQKLRITSFLGSHQQQAASYNADQALIAVGSGQFLGRGLGQGVQSHLRFLPERQTDFIFASLAEELGFIGAASVLVGYFSLVVWLVVAADRTAWPMTSYFLFGVATMFVVQVTINVGMNMGLLPITGITLPLVSYGGSSALGTCVSLGLAQALSCQSWRVSEMHLA